MDAGLFALEGGLFFYFLFFFEKTEIISLKS